MPASAHIYISSRPYAWRPVLDRALIEEVLPFEPQRQEATGGDDLSTVVQSGEAIEGDYSAAGTSKDDPPPTLQLYQLAPLDESEIVGSGTWVIESSRHVGHILRR